MDLIDRARAYVAKMPEAVSGQDGHGATFAVAKVLLHFFGLPRDQAATVLAEYNQRCVPPWSAKELNHKLDSAAKARWEGARAVDKDKTKPLKATSGPARTGKSRTLRTGFAKSVKQAGDSVSQSRTLRTDFLHNYVIHARTLAHDVERTCEKNPSEVSEVATGPDAAKEQVSSRQEQARVWGARLQRVNQAARDVRAGYSTWINAHGAVFAAAKRVVGEGQGVIEVGQQLFKP